MSSFQNDPNSGNGASDNADLRFRRSLGYYNDAEYENAESTTQFHVQSGANTETVAPDDRFRKSLGYYNDAEYENAESTTQFHAQSGANAENVDQDDRFKKSLGYSESTGEYAAGFRAQSQSAAQQQGTSARMMRSFGYYDYQNGDQPYPQFSRREGHVAQGGGSNAPRPNSGEAYVKDIAPRKQKLSLSKEQKKKKVALKKNDDPRQGSTPYQAPPAQNGYGSPVYTSAPPVQNNAPYKAPPAQNGYGSPVYTSVPPVQNNAPYKAPPAQNGYGSPVYTSAVPVQNNAPYKAPPAQNGYGSPVYTSAVPVQNSAPYQAPPAQNGYGSPVPANAPPAQNGYGNTPYVGAAAAGAALNAPNVSQKSNGGAVSLGKIGRGKNALSELAFTGFEDGMQHTARAFVNKSRRRFKKLINNLFTLLKAWCTLLCPIVTMVLYAQPLGLISRETHVLMLKSAIVIFPLTVIAETIFDLLTVKTKTKARVISFETRSSSDEDGTTYSYPTLLYHYHNGEYYLSKLTLRKKPQPGQEIAVRFDPQDPGDVKERFNPVYPLIQIVVVTLFVANVARVILGWESGAITNYNSD